MIPSVLAAILGVVAFTAAPAFADTAPSVTIEPASAVTYTTAHVSGTVSPNGGPSATAWVFEYSKNPEAEGWTAAGGGEFTGIQATGTTPLAVQSTLEGLTPNTTYQVRLVATNAGGEAISSEPNPSFTTKEVAKPTVTAPVVSALTATTAHFSATVNPNAPGAAPGQDAAFNTAWHFRCTPACPAAEGAGEVPATNTAQEVSVSATGLVPTTTYLVELVASNLGGEAIAGPETFTTPAAPPEVSGESFSEAGSASVRLSANVNPGGSATSYRFEYGTNTGYGSATPSASAGGSVTAVGVIGQISELQPETLYHFRLTAANEKGETHGIDTTFQTSPVGVLGLPDGRGYEMVSGTANGGSSVYEPELPGRGWSNTEGYGAITRLQFQAAADGTALAYVGDPPPTGGNGSVGKDEGNQYLAKRREAGGWAAGDIQPPGVEGATYQAFSRDLSMGLLDATEPLSAAAPGGKYDVLYSSRLADGLYRPLFSLTPPHRDAEEFGVYPGGSLVEPLVYAGGSSDMAHLLFEANDALTEPESVDGGRKANNLYDSVGGVLRSVNILPDGKPEAKATFGGPNTTGRHNDEPDFERVISSDGSRIFWTDLNTNEIYMRENDTTSHPTTVHVGSGQYWTASTDGSKVFFTNSGVAYRYDVESGVTTDLSPDVNPGEEAGVQGVIGASEDGSYVYFVATGRLAAGATPGEPNLYLTHDGAITLIAVLSPADNEIGLGSEAKSVGDWQAGLGVREAQVTPDGRHLAFASVRSLTGYENGGRQVFVYDAVSGRLSCASCNPTGEPPRTGQTAGVPVSWSNAYMHRWISSDGTRVFFDSRESLVPQDRNGQVDVYEWEQEGAGSCRRAGGCIYLLSGGTSADGSFFLDASATGNDVFIVTRAQLVPADKNEVFDAYDVRVGASEPPAPTVCTGTGCQGLPGVAPTLATPSSSTITGTDDAERAPPGKPRVETKAEKLTKALSTCRKKYKKSKKRRRACEKQAHKVYGATAKKATKTGRTK